ncbi:MAG: hypothetical protein ACJA08_000408 [Cyclobacteriaceae bacterium]|jgi:hypothetical protein
MKRIYLSVTFLATLSLAALAQDADSTVTKEVVAPIEVVKPKVAEVKPETPEVKATPVIAKQDSTINQLPSVEPPLDGQPRIIYYQDSKPEYKDKRNDIKTLSGSMSHSGGFFGVSFRASEFKDEAVVLAGFRTGWIVNRTLGIGFEGHGVIPTTKFDDIDPIRNTILLGGYGGMYMELVAFSNQVVHVTFPISGGAGWLGYHEDWDADGVNDPRFSGSDPIIDQDVFWYIEPGASLEMNISRSFRMAFGVSKRFTQDLELINTRSADFENLNFFITLKLGKF